MQLEDLDYGKDVEEAVGDISIALENLTQLPLENLSGANLVDVAARLNAQHGRLEKIIKPLKDKIRVEVLHETEGNPFPDAGVIRRGDTYQAKVQKLIKTVLDTPLIKAFLGAELYKFQKDQEEIRISFGVKE